jgi:NAD(P)-dependent dehydrogenase (short-subunit alcohol dehydrogenase family)
MRGLSTGLGLLAAGSLVWAWRNLVPRPEADLTGQVALITGGSRGLGLIMARQLAEAGCRLVICARDARELAQAARDLQVRGADVLAIQCDVTEEASVEQLVAVATGHFGGVDILVNNAGIIQGGPIESMSVEDFDDAMEVNFWGAVYATMAVLPQMRERGYGRIVNITSIAGKVSVPHMLPYNCSKFAFRGFSEGLATEVAKDGITVTTVVPSLMRTGSPVNALFKGDVELEFLWFSLLDSLPFSSTDAEQAAREIVTGLRRGDTYVSYNIPAQALGLLHDLAPEATIALLSLVNRWLPRGEMPFEPPVRGMHIATPLSPSFLTVFMNNAAKRFNQYGGQTRPTEAHAEQVGL